MARDFKTEEYSRVCVCVGGEGACQRVHLTHPSLPPSIFKKPEQFSLLTIFDWSW